jgi:hypothetical protein
MLSAKSHGTAALRSALGGITAMSPRSPGSVRGPIVVKSFVANQRGVYPRQPYIAVRRAARPSEGQRRDGTLLRAVNDIHGNRVDIHGKESRFPGESKKARGGRHSCPTMNAPVCTTVTPRR